MVDSSPTVYWATPDLAQDALLNICDSAERLRHAAYRQAADRDRFLVGVAVVRQLAAAELHVPAAAVPIDRSCLDCDRPHGPPVLPGTGLTFSVSHSGRLVAVAVARGHPVGVDVEAVPDDPVPDLASMSLAPSEECSTAAEFIHYWTCKEAVLKCTGDGLRVRMNDVVISPLGDTPALLAYPRRPDYPRRITLATLRPVQPGYAAALAWMPPPGRLAPVGEAVVDSLWPSLVGSGRAGSQGPTGGVG